MPIELADLPIGGAKGPSPVAELPRKASLSASVGWDTLPERFFTNLPTTHNQEHAGSCVAHGFSAALEAFTKQQTGAHVELCRMDIYRGARLLERDGSETRDEGCYLHHAASWLADQGSCSEALWPYDPSRVTLPPSASIAEQILLERPHHRTRWGYLRDMIQVAAALCGADGKPSRPVVIGRGVYNNTTRVGQTGVHEGVSGGMLGGHCSAIVGFDRFFVPPGAGGDVVGAFLEMNSWAGWGTNHPHEQAAATFAWIPFRVWDGFVWESWAPREPLPVSI